MQKIKRILSENIFLLSCISLIILSIIFYNNGFYNVQNDTTKYVNQILYFSGNTQLGNSVSSHAFKPFYGLMGSLLYPNINPYQAILLINILFYIGLVFSMYFFLLELHFEKNLSLIGSVWVATGYPVLKYGLALLTDVSGWFFAVLTCYLFLVAIRKENRLLFIMVSCVAFIGSLCKETGVLGLVFAETYLAFYYLSTKNRAYLVYGLLTTLPFLILQFILRLVTTQTGGKTFLDWFMFNVTTNTSEKFHSLHYFIPTEGATFSILWLYTLFAGFIIIKKTLYKNKKLSIIGICLLIATLPALLWPLFYVRIFFIQILFVIPLSLLGISYLMTKTNKFFYKSLLVTAPILTNLSLFFLANGGSLFDIFHL